MQGKQIRMVGIAVLGAAAVCVAMYFRGAQQGEVAEKARSDAMEVLVRVDGYEANRAFFDKHTEAAHQSGTKGGYGSSGPVGRATFDPNDYLASFFGYLVAQAKTEGKPDLAKSLTEYCEEEGVKPKS